MLEGFLKAAKDDTQGLNVAALMSDEEQLQWEILVKAMDSIDIMNIGKDLEKLTKHTINSNPRDGKTYNA